MIDLAILGILLLSLLLGWSRGIVRGALSLAAAILALVTASYIGNIASGILVEEVIRPAVFESVAERVEELSVQELLLSPLEKMEQALEAVENEYVRREAEKLLDAMELSSEAADGMAKDSLLALSGEVLDTVLYGGVRRILSAVICVLLYAVISLVLRPVVFVIAQAFKLPVLRQADQLGGLALGAVKGVLLVFLAVWALRTFGILVTEEIVEQSVLLPHITALLDGGRPAV